MSTMTHHGKGRRFSRAVVYNGTAHFSGLTATDRTGDITSQTRDILAKADGVLAEIGSDKSRLLSAMIWLRDIEDFNGMNSEWEKWIDLDHPPARATVESRLAAPDVRIEILFTAAVD